MRWLRSSSNAGQSEAARLPVPFLVRPHATDFQALKNITLPQSRTQNPFGSTVNMSGVSIASFAQLAPHC